jgi:hypothetical protein
MSNSANISKCQTMAGTMLYPPFVVPSYKSHARLHLTALRCTINLLTRQFGPPRAHIAWLVNTTEQNDK